MPVITDLQLTITPTYGLYSLTVPDNEIVVSEDSTQGRKAIILDLSNAALLSDPVRGEGLYTRDLGTVFSWPTGAKTVIDVWQPSIIPLDEDLYLRMSYTFLLSSLGGVGWQHAREMNISHNSTADLNVEFSVGNGDISPAGFIIPNSGGTAVKQKFTLTPNKWKVIQCNVYSTAPFLLWVNDMEFKIKSWGSTGSYRVVKPLKG